MQFNNRNCRKYLAHIRSTYGREHKLVRKRFSTIMNIKEEVKSLYHINFITTAIYTAVNNLTHVHLH